VPLNRSTQRNIVHDLLCHTAQRDNSTKHVGRLVRGLRLAGHAATLIGPSQHARTGKPRQCFAAIENIKVLPKVLPACRCQAACGVDQRPSVARAARPKGGIPMFDIRGRQLIALLGSTAASLSLPHGRARSSASACGAPACSCSSQGTMRQGRSAPHFSGEGSTCGP
jgi:hypothetical protein